MIPKPGKSEKRPLGLPDFDNKMVQEVIRMILESIYEPEFDYYDCNSGFRPKRDCNHAIRNISQKAQFADFAIEGDIVGAYNNVDHDILINLIKTRVKDNKFLKLIYDGFKAGIVEDFTYYDTILGVPQGGISSPILFNIYMHEFDKYVLNTLKNEVALTNELTHRVEVTAEYSTKKSQLLRARQKLEKIDTVYTPENPPTLPLFRYLIDILEKYPEKFTNINFISRLETIKKNIESAKLEKAKQNANAGERSELRRKLTFEQRCFIHSIHTEKLQHKVAVTRSEMRDTPYLDINRKANTFYYHRYADDWTLWLRGNKETAILLKEEISSFLGTKLKLELSPQKTVITELDKEKAKFLGFEIYFPKNPILRKGTGATRRVRAIQISVDQVRLKSRFTLKGYMDNKERPREIGWLTVLTNQEIVTKYNQFMLGFGNYYIPEISQVSYLGRWHYLLYYSCIKTLATKNKMSVKSVIRTFGFTDLSVEPKTKKQTATDQRICIEYFVDKKPKWVTLLNYKEFMYKILQYRDKYRSALNQDPNNPILTPAIDFRSMHKSNFRTTMKLTTACTVCGDTGPLQNHHIKPIRHSGGKFSGYKGFDKMVASLGRKQISVCQTCHTSIHSGKYNGISLEDIYDVRLAVPESYIKIELPKSPTTNPTRDNTGNNKYGDGIIINKNDRTYLNIPFRNYLLSK